MKALLAIAIAVLAIYIFASVRKSLSRWSNQYKTDNPQDWPSPAREEPETQEEDEFQFDEDEQLVVDRELSDISIEMKNVPFNEGDAKGIENGIASRALYEWAKARTQQLWQIVRTILSM